MLYALLDDQKVLPTPKTHAKCPLCKGKVISKCGEIRVWYWAHANGENCDPWHESETRWHLNWKRTFGKAYSEITITKNNKWHRADIQTKENLIIELQNSPIKKQVIAEREEFYGDKMLWIINGREFKKNFYISDLDHVSYWEQKNHINCKSYFGVKKFNWEYPRRSWEQVRRPLFIDFHDGYLFWVKKGMGSVEGKGQFVSKKDFISKYGGDFNIHLKLFRNFTKKLNRKSLSIHGIKENNIYLTSTISFNGKARVLEIYLKNLNDIEKIKQTQNLVFNGTLKFEEENRNLQLINSRILK